jgi:flagellar hook-length control protein FliK
VDPETNQPISFGELLKLKEKQLQHAQDISASAVAAALMALQTMTNVMPAPVPDVGTASETNNTTIQQMQVQSTMPVDSKLTGISTPANAIETTEFSAFAGLTNRVIPTETPASAAETFSNALAENASQQTPVQSQFSEKPTTSFVTAQVSKPAAQPNVRTQTATSLTDRTGEVVDTAAKNIKPKVNPIHASTTETPAATSVVNAENESAIPVRKSQTLTDADIATQVSTAQSSPLQTEAKDNKLPRNVYSQPAVISNFQTTVESTNEVHVEGKISKAELTSASQPETLDAPPVQYSAVQHEANEDTILFASEPVEIPEYKVTTKTESSTPISVQPAVAQTDINQQVASFEIKQTEELTGTSATTVEIPDKAPVQRSSAASTTDQTTTSFSSEQIEKPVHISSPTLETSDETPASQTVTDWKPSPVTSQPSTDSANMLSEKAEVSDEFPVQFMDVQPEIDQKTIPFVSTQADEPGNISVLKAPLPDTTSTQYSTSQPMIYSNTAGNTAQQDVKPSTISPRDNVILNDHEGLLPQMRESHDPQQPFSSQRLDIPRETDKIVSDVKTPDEVIPTTQESTPEVKIPLSALASSPKKIETEPRPVMPPTVTKTEASSTASVQPANNPASVQAEVKHEGLTFETKSAEIRSGEMPRQVPMKQIPENLIKSAEIHKAEKPMQIPLADASASEVVARPQVEKNTSEVSSPVKLSTSQPAMKAPLAQAEIESTELAGDATAEKTTTPHPAPKQTFQPLENNEQSVTTKSAQVTTKAADETTPDANNYRETKKAASQEEIPAEADITSQIQGLPETMRRTTVNDAETVHVDVKQPMEFNNTFALEDTETVLPETEVIEKPDISAKRIASSDNKTERPVVNSTQPIPDVAPDLVSTNQNKVNKQTIDVGLLDPFSNEAAQPEIHMQNTKSEIETIEKQSVASEQVRENTQAATFNAELSAVSIATPRDNDTEKLDKVTTIPAEDIPAATFVQTASYVSSNNPVVSSHETDAREVKTSAPLDSKSSSVLEVAQPDVDLPAVDKVGANIQASAGTVKEETQTIGHSGVAVDAVPSQTFVESKKVSVTSEIATPQASKIAISVDETQSAQPAFVLTDASDKTETADGQPAAKTDATQATPLQPKSDFPQAQTTATPKIFNPEIKSVDAEVEIPVTVVELPQSDFIVSASSQGSNQAAKDNSETSTAPQVTVLFDAPKPQPFEPKTKPMEHKDVETQVNVETTLPTQNTNKSAVEVEDVAPVIISGTSDQKETVVALVEKFDHARSMHTNKPETVDSKTAVSTPAIENKEIPVPSQPGVSVKAKPEMENLETRQIDSTDEKPRPVEKQSKLNQTPDVTVAATDPGKEAAVSESSGKMPLHEANVQATEIVQQVIRQMNVKIKNGPSSMHLQLNPKDLGAIDVEMVNSSQGVHVTFFAEQAGTGKLLESQLTQLRDSLVDSGVQLSGLNISQHNQSGQKGGSFNQENNFARYPEREFTQTETNHKETARTEKIVGQTSEVDYRI